MANYVWYWFWWPVFETFVILHAKIVKLNLMFLQHQMDSIKYEIKKSTVLWAKQFVPRLLYRRGVFGWPRLPCMKVPNVIIILLFSNNKTKMDSHIKKFRQFFSTVDKNFAIRGKKMSIKDGIRTEFEWSISIEKINTITDFNQDSQMYCIEMWNLTEGCLLEFSFADLCHTEKKHVKWKNVKNWRI